MREYGQIQCAFWQSRTCKAISNEARVLAAYLLSGPHSNGIGCYVLPDGYVMGDLKWSEETVSESFTELCSNGFAYRFDEVVFIPEFVRWNTFRNWNVAKARMEEFRVLPRGESKAQVAAEILKYGEHLSDSHKADLTAFKDAIRNDLEIIRQISSEQNPTQTLPNPDPTRVLRTIRKSHGNEGSVPRETLGRDFDDWFLTEYPPCTGRRSMTTALHNCSVLVGSGKITEERLRANITGYRAYVDGGGPGDLRFVLTPQNFTDPLAEDPQWIKPWGAPLSKAEKQQDETLAAAQHLLAHGSNL